jgi:hypothetical protein
LASLNDTAAIAALNTAGVAAATTTFAGVLNTALASFTASAPGEQARRDFVKQANLALERAGLPGWVVRA